MVIAKDHNGLPLLIEVLRYVHGVSNEELRDPVYTVAVGETLVQVPSPIALLRAKIANVADIAQTGRQDAGHVVILAQVLPAYFEDLQKAVVEGRMEERISGAPACGSQNGNGPKGTQGIEARRAPILRRPWS